MQLVENTLYIRNTQPIEDIIKKLKDLNALCVERRRKSKVGNPPNLIMIYFDDQIMKSVDKETKKHLDLLILPLFNGKVVNIDIQIVSIK
jgi:hypothetical protein